MRDMEDTKLDRDQIMRTALQVMQSDGIDGLSMRKLAARLNVRAPTLYWYFPDRASILRSVIKTLLAETIHRVPDSDAWQIWLQRFGEELWQTNRQTPLVTMLLQSAEFNDQEIFEMAIHLLDERARHFSIDRVDFLRVHSDLQALVLGWAVYFQAGVTNRIQGFFDVDQAVKDGIQGIISVWDMRFKSRQA